MLLPARQPPSLLELLLPPLLRFFWAQHTGSLLLHLLLHYVLCSCPCNPPMPALLSPGCSHAPSPAPRHHATAECTH